MLRQKFLPLRIIAITIVIVSLGLPLIASRQNVQNGSLPPKLIEELKRLQKAALESDYAYKQTAYLANNIGPRLSGSPQAEASVKYVAEEMRRVGATVQLEPVMVPHWVRGEETGALVEYPGPTPQTPQKVVLTALGGSVATPAEGITAEVVVVENYEQLGAMGRTKVEGKMVLFNVRFDKEKALQGFAGEAYGEAVIYRGGGASAAARLGASAALVRSVGSADYRLPHTGSMFYAADAPRIPAAAVAAEDADLIAYLAAQGRVRMNLKLTPQTLPDAPSHNVIADIKGTEFPDQVVIVSGHLDSWDLGTGAIDDATGVAVAMQIANLVKQLGLKPKRTIRVIAWMNEENGLMGGRTYAKNQEKNLANHYAAIEMDFGAGHPTGFFAHASQQARPMLDPVANILRSQGAGIIRFVTEPVGADISPLEIAGVPGFSPLVDARTYFDYHHTAADTLDKVGPRELAENAAVLAVLTYALANFTEPLPR